MGEQTSPQPSSGTVGLARAGKKMGRPKTENPKTVELGMRLDAPTAEVLEAYCKRHDISKAEALRRGIMRLAEEDAAE